MPLFRRDDEPTPSVRPGGGPPSPQPGPSGPGPAPKERGATRIAEGTRVEGEITGNTELLVEGEVTGTLRIEARAVVGSSGVVRGEIEARSVMVAGEVYGDVRGRERVEVGPSGRIEGDISAPRVTIAEGAFFKGKVEMGEGGRGSARSGGADSQDKPKPGTETSSDRPSSKA
jgi:cytoskeletal protein CcmA (bactofilin family)